MSEVSNRHLRTHSGSHVRSHSGSHGMPVGLGPLAVQLLPTGPGLASTSDLREQIQRQRQNLTDHTTRTLPHPANVTARAASHQSTSGEDQHTNTLPKRTEALAVKNAAPPETFSNSNSGYANATTSKRNYNDDSEIITDDSVLNCPANSRPSVEECIVHSDSQNDRVKSNETGTTDKIVSAATDNISREKSPINSAGLSSQKSLVRSVLFIRYSNLNCTLCWKVQCCYWLIGTITL